MRELSFYQDEYYHVYHRGVDKRIVFVDDLDRQRMYWMMYLLNDWDFDSTAIKWTERFSMISVQTDIPEIDSRKRMVDILSLNFLGNHLHILLRATTDDSVSKFMHRLLTSHSKYFNRRHGRSGSLFDDRFGAVHIKTDAQLLHVPIYIHLNTLDMFGVQWREGSVVDWDAAQKLLDSHKYSSHAFYSGGRQELPIVDAELVTGLFPDKDTYLSALKGWSNRYVVTDFDTIS
ncbi:MAG: transposase [bacterium]|nr:transposase [bacterium]